MVVLVEPAQTHSATISVLANTTGDPVTTYNFLRGTVSGGESATPIGTVAATTCTTTCTFTDLTVLGGVTYFYTVTASNSFGTSSPSPESKTTVPLNAPNIPATPTVTSK